MDVIQVLSGANIEHTTWRTIILDFRLPKSLTAILAGSALAVSGLQMQTLFRNPLADPFILGVSSGASLGVAMILLNAGAAGSFLLSGLGYFGNLGIAGAASLGAAFVLGLVLLVARRTHSTLVLLILGLMLSYITGAIVSLLFYFSIHERIQAYIAWSFGSFAGVTWSEMRIMAPSILVGLGMALMAPKPLNALLLGESYAQSMGLNIRKTRLRIIISTSLLAGVVTAFCGPISFLGLAVPHICRGLFQTSDHRILIPLSCLLGAILALFADLATQMPNTQVILPLNVITSLIGAPIVIWVLLTQYHLRAEAKV
jgi:iron complex transport system permease protein